MSLRSRGLRAALAALVLSVAPACARQVKDMAGDVVTVPDRPIRAAAYNPPLSYFIAVVDPKSLVALNRTPTADERRHLPPSVLALPVIGSWFDRMNKEALVSLHPDVVLIEPRGSVADEAASELPRLGLAYARVRYDRLNDIAPLFRFLGRLLGDPQRGDALAAYADRTLREIDARVAKIPKSRRPKVYYARGPDGLQTACGEGTQLEVTVRAGGRPALLCGFGPGRRGRRSVSLDQVIAMRPDVIFATDPAFLKTIRTDWRWKAVKAVADGRVYLAPTDMGGWIDRPPLFTRLLGLTWAYDRLYEPPKKADADIAAAKAKFFKLFFHESPPK